MATINDIESVLRAQLPADLHVHIPALAQVLARLSNSSLPEKEAQHRLSDPVLSQILRTLVGRQLSLTSGDYITIGNITDSKAIATGAGAVAIGDIVIHIHAPTAISDFTHWPPSIPQDRFYPLPGRERNLSLLLDVLHDSQGASVLVIDGLGGTGKTALAVELARRALHFGHFKGVVGDSAKQELFSGGDIVPIREATLDFSSLLDAIARQLGRWDLPTLKLEEKLAALAHLLQRHRYLVLVDNLETTENAHGLIAQIRGLLVNSRAIITSREQVRYDFVRPISLQGLDLEDSLFFLRSDAEQRGVEQILHAPEASLIEIHTIAGGAPLALKLVAAQAQFLDLELVLRRLRPVGSKLYTFIFRQSWEALAPEAQRVLIYIGKTVITTVGWEELSSVAIADNDDVLIAALDQLVSYSLLDTSTVNGQMRYGIHQLTRQFVNSELPELWKEKGLL